MANEFPHFQFDAIDVQPLTPGLNMPRNCHLYNYNVVSRGLLFNYYFDYIHQRNLLFAIPHAEVRSHLTHIYTRMKLPGLLELREWNWFLRRAGPNGTTINGWVQEVLAKSGVDLEKTLSDLEQELKSVGFSAVELEIIMVPAGNWGGEAGQEALENWCWLLRNMWPRLERLGVSRTEFDQRLHQWTMEVNQFRTYWELIVCVGEKRT